MANVKYVLLVTIVLPLACESSGSVTTLRPTTSSTGSGTGGTAACPSSKYRSIDSSCSSRLNPSWGKANQPFGRMLPPNYADGISSPPVMLNGSEYVNARKISFEVFAMNEIPDPNNTLINVFFMHAIGNDLNSPAGVNDAIKCCANGKVIPGAPSRCYPVQIPSNDPLYSWFEIQCLDLLRVQTAPAQQPPQPAQQINSATGLLDLSFLYGTSVAQSNSLRTLSGGRLQAVRRSGVEWPVINPAGCTWSGACYLVADSRMYQFPMTATVHLLFFREHNRLANQLKLVNPTWSDEVLFQEARRINIAQYQYIVYYHYLPRILGQANMLSNQLIFEGTGFTSDYNAFQDPSAIGEFGNVVLPFFQSQLPGSINFYVNGTVQSMQLSSTAGNLSMLETGFASIYAGLTTQSTNLLDTSFSIEWKNFMYRGSAALGQDILALDIQRMRDFGFARYNDYRSRCGLNRFATWEAFNATLKQPCPVKVEKLQSFYSSVDDLDLFVGAALEDPLAGSLLGPTFICLIKQQFLALRTGDRYFFETGGQDGSFTTTQLTEIRKTSLARLMCSGFPTMSQIQPDAFGAVSAKNALASCNSLPNVNLAAWRV